MKIITAKYYFKPSINFSLFYWNKIIKVILKLNIFSVIKLRSKHNFFFNCRSLKFRPTVKSTSKDDLKEKNVDKNEKSCSGINNNPPLLTLKIKGLTTNEFEIVNVSL